MNVRMYGVCVHMHVCPSLVPDWLDEFYSYLKRVDPSQVWCPVNINIPVSKIWAFQMAPKK
jgi:hypothetical protein